MHYVEAVNQKPDFAEAYHNLGRLLAAQGQLDAAVERFQQAVRARPDFADAYLSLSQALSEQGRKDEALRFYHEANRLQRGLSVSPQAR